MPFDISQFALVALAHFLALLSPGPDFFLILRSAVVHGFRRAAAVCVGIALANGVFILLAIGGVGLVPQDTPLFRWISLAGALYLAWLGWLFLRHAGQAAQPVADAATPGAGGRALLAGFLSGALNPKNSLFYASLFALLGQSAPPLGVQAFYGVWMFGVVLLWDLGVAALCRHPVVIQRLLRQTGRIERATGLVLWVIASSVAFHALA